MYRRMLCTVLLIASTLALPARMAGPAIVDAHETLPVPVPELRLRLFNAHTNERIDVVYRRGDAYQPDALAQLDQFLRDHRTGAVHRYDPRVFDLLADLTESLGRPDAEIEIVCGYRSPWSNEYLRAHTTGVAKNSLHMQAEAIDIRVPPVRTSVLRRAALALQRGGVGYYPQSGFVHVDVGPFRQW
jgi:uncharacterized protein YcbK (DUF882 family)